MMFLHNYFEIEHNIDKKINLNKDVLVEIDR